MIDFSENNLFYILSYFFPYQLQNGQPLGSVGDWGNKSYIYIMWCTIFSNILYSTKTMEAKRIGTKDQSKWCVLKIQTVFCCSYNLFFFFCFMFSSISFIGQDSWYFIDLMYTIILFYKLKVELFLMLWKKFLKNHYQKIMNWIFCWIGWFFCLKFCLFKMNAVNKKKLMLNFTWHDFSFV